MRGSKNNNNNPSSPDRYSNSNNNNNGVTAASTTQNYPHSPHTPGSVAGSTFFNDAMTVDSWNTTMTAMLQPHKNQKNTFQCPTHLSFTTKDPLDACPHCERQQQLTLQERRRSVEQQLRDMDQQAKGGTSGTSGAVANNSSSNKKGSSSSSTNNVAKDILQDLQSTVQQWKQQPVAATTTVPSNPTPQPQPPTHTATPTPSTPGTTTSGNDQSHATDLTGATHAADNTQTTTTAGAPMLHSSPAVGNTASTAAGPPQPPPVMTMPPPMPPMVPSFGTTPPPPPGAAPTTATASGTPLEALALQIQGMQRMQDWMLYQKEQECQTLRQRLDSATQQINTLAVENALLQEKLNQQEQRMKHELKLIKLAALQQRNGSTKNKNGSSDTSNTGNPMVVTAPRGSGASIASHHSGGSGSANNNNNNTSSNNNNDSFGFPSNETPQPKTAVITSALSRQEHQSIFHNHTTASASTQPHGNSVGMTPSSPGNPASVQSAGSSSGRDPMGAVSAATGETNPALTMSNSLSMSPEQQKSGDDSDNNIQNNKGPVDLDDITEMINAKKEGGSVRSAAGSGGHAEAPPPANNPSDDFSYQNIPRDIQIDPSTSASSSNPAVGAKPTSNKPTAAAAAIQPLPPPPDTSKGNNSQPPLQAATTPVSGLPAAATVTPSPSSEHNAAAAPPILVNFPDSSDNMSVGNTVASSTYGEDRQQVTSQIILDPYGDRGTYTGVILRSTGMPHGSGRMIYQEDKRTYDGEWRHGRWHGYGRATFANGDNYHGEYRFDQRHGRGRYEWNDGRVYDGMFKEDKRHGRGVFTWPDGAVYEGDFRMGQREGHGTYRFSDGGRYEGSWKDGRYNGFGICNWEDGRCYKGEWLGGMAHGKGVETFADGTVRHDGQWIEDEPVVS